MNTAVLLLAVLPAVAIVPVGLRWLLVAQKEHYLPGSAVRFATRWTLLVPINRVLAVVVAGALVGAWLVPRASWALAMLVAAAAAVWPVGLPVTGVAWTARLRRVATLAGLLAAASVAAVVAILGVEAGLAVGIATAIGLLDPLVDLALLILGPVERRLQRRWIDRARSTLRSVQPRVVAITGSFGKTTAKEYARRVLSASSPTLASPASFNNAMGLARTVNEHLTPGTKFFVAEMGAYGPGEIAELCEWIPPDIAAITAIGPVHLERFGSIDVTVASKAEIAARASVVVLNCDDDRLSDLADDLERQGKRIIRTGTSHGVDVYVEEVDGEWSIRVGGIEVSRVARVPFPTNLAVAIGIGVAADVPLHDLAVAFADAEAPTHRQSVTKGANGFWIIDDTFNSNPAGAAAALETLASLGKGRKVVITPGMVELGSEQRPANRSFAAQAARIADDLLVVNRTNRRALLAGASEGRARVHTLPDRPAAVEWVRAHLGPDDAALYENDLPSHYP